MKRNYGNGRTPNVGNLGIKQKIMLEIVNESTKITLYAKADDFEKSFAITNRGEFKSQTYSDSIITNILFKARIINYRNSKCVIDSSLFQRLRESKMVYYFLTSDAWAEVFITRLTSYSKKIFTILYDNQGIKQGVIYTFENEYQEVGREEALNFSRINM